MNIKICGLYRDCDIDFVNEAHPDYIGFVFAKSRRQIVKEQASFFKKKLDPDIKAVGVFVDEELEVINSMVSEHIIDMVQLHGEEEDRYIKLVNAPTIKAVRIGQNIPEHADYILFDGMEAGSGRVFDWSALPKTKQSLFLAGGINAGNIAEAIKLNPFCIDLSSGVETNGYKDKEKIAEMVRRVRNV